jgi:flavin reductase
MNLAGSSCLEQPTADFRQSFLDAMRRTASTVSVVTTSAPERGPLGVTVSSLCSLSADPCSLLVCVHHLSRAAAEINQNKLFCVNVLGSEHAAIADCFAGRSAEPEQRFNVGAWSLSRSGMPALRGAIARLDCELQWSQQFASHFIFIGTVIDVSVSDGCPLVYSDRAYRQLVPATSL